MSNPLKNIFSVDEPEYKITVNFTDADAKNNCLELIDKAIEDGVGVEIDGVEKVMTFTETKQGKQLLETHDNITKFFIAPTVEEAPYTIQTDYGEYVFDFVRQRRKSQIILKNADNSIVHIQIIYEGNGKELKLAYKTNPLIADKIKTIIYAYNAAWHFIEKLLGKNINTEIEKALTGLKDLESYWIRVHQIEKELKLEFDPKNINDSVNDEGDIENLYLLLVKKKPLKRNLNSLTFTLNFADLMNKNPLKCGDKFHLSLNGEINYFVYGIEFKIYTANHIMNAILESIEEISKEEQYEIKLVGSDTKPLYDAYWGFISETEAKDALKNPELIILAKQAKSFNDTIQEMQNEYNSSVRMQE